MGGRWAWLGASFGFWVIPGRARLPALRRRARVVLHWMPKGGGVASALIAGDARYGGVDGWRGGQGDGARGEGCFDMFERRRSCVCLASGQPIHRCLLSRGGVAGEWAAWLAGLWLSAGLGAGPVQRWAGLWTGVPACWIVVLGMLGSRWTAYGANGLRGNWWGRWTSRTRMTCYGGRVGSWVTVGGRGARRTCG